MSVLLFDDLYHTYILDGVGISTHPKLLTGRCYEAEICAFFSFRDALSDDIFFVEVKIFNFWPKTMDYSPWFRQFLGWGETGHWEGKSQDAPPL